MPWKPWRHCLWSLGKIHNSAEDPWPCRGTWNSIIHTCFGANVDEKRWKSLFLQNGFHSLLLTGSLIYPWILDRFGIFKLSSHSLGSCRGLGSICSLKEFRMAAVEDIPEVERTRIYTRNHKFAYFSKLWKSISPRRMGQNGIRRCPWAGNYQTFQGKIPLVIYCAHKCP